MVGKSWWWAKTRFWLVGMVFSHCGAMQQDFIGLGQRADRPFMDRKTNPFGVTTSSLSPGLIDKQGS
jgi:hypothetical protein